MGLRRQFDQQAEGHSSDCVLKPVAVFPDSTRKNGVLVMCEVMMPDGKTPHPSNKRATILDDAGRLVRLRAGIFLLQGRRPLGFPDGGFPAPQGPYYTGVGYKNVGDVAREIVEKHLDLCLDAGINHEGINAEVAKGQWEFQIFGKGSKSAADEMWMARYLLQRLCEKYGIDIEWHCKPLGDTDWNGSGMHANFSTDVYARDRRQGIFREADGGVRATPRGPHRGLRAGQPPAPHRQARDGSRSTSSATAWPTAAPRSACRTASSTTATRATWKTAVRTRKATPTRSPRRS